MITYPYDLNRSYGAEHDPQIKITADRCLNVQIFNQLQKMFYLVEKNTHHISSTAVSSYK